MAVDSWWRFGDRRLESLIRATKAKAFKENEYENSSRRKILSRLSMVSVWY